MQGSTTTIPNGTKPIPLLHAAKISNYRAAPLYYGMLMFAIAGRGRSGARRKSCPSIQNSVPSPVTKTGSLWVCLINKDLTRPSLDRQSSRMVVFTSMQSVLRLMGPSIDFISGVTLGGAAVDDAGRWLPIVEEISNPENAEIVIGVEPSSAALIQISSIGETISSLCCERL